MKRYNWEYRDVYRDHACIVADDGEWVRYEDVEALEQRHADEADAWNQERQALHALLRRIRATTWVYLSEELNACIGVELGE